MKKIVITLIAVVSIMGTTLAQNGKMGVGVQAGVGFPMGDIGDYLNTGFGATGTFFYGLEDNITLTGSIGFISFSYDIIDATFSSVPVLFGARYYFGQSKTRFYTMAELGMYFSSASASTPIGVISSSTSDFGLSFGGGVQHPVSETIDIDANIKYNMPDFSSDGWFTIMAGVDVALD